MIEKYALLKVIRGIIRETSDFSIRSISRKLKIGASTSKEALDFLFLQGILEKRVIGRNHLFKIKNTFLTKQIKVLYSLSEINFSGLAEELIGKIPELICAVVYGSVAKGEDDNKSDIDILLITRKSIRVPELKSQKFLSREITIINYTYKEWKAKSEKEKAFYYEVILNCIILYGEKPVVS